MSQANLHNKERVGWSSEISITMNCSLILSSPQAWAPQATSQSMASRSTETSLSATISRITTGRAP